MEQRLLEIMSEILKLDKETLLAAFDEKTIWDSLRRVEILFAIEDEFDISFDENELKELDTPRKLSQAAVEKGA